MCAYVTDRAAAGLSFGTVTMALSAIAYGHHRAGLSSPTDHDAVRQVRRGLRRALGTAATRQARPFSVDDIHQLVQAIDRTTRAGARDTAITLQRSQQFPLLSVRQADLTAASVRRRSGLTRC